MEQAVQFRIGMLLGRFLRYQGEFVESLAHLKQSRDEAEKRGSLFFDEDLRDLTCNLADTFRELDDPIALEHHFRAEITRRDRSSACSSQAPLLTTLSCRSLSYPGTLRSGRAAWPRDQVLSWSFTIWKVAHTDCPREDILCQDKAQGSIISLACSNGGNSKVLSHQSIPLV